MANHGSRRVAAVLVTCFAAGAAHASGFGLREGSTDALGNAFAGQTAKAYDAATAWENPAGMVRLNLSEIDGSINYIDPHASFRGQNLLGPATVTSGVGGGNAVESAATGGVFAVWSYSPNLKFGAAVTSPFGERVAYPGNFVGRYQSLVSSITDVQATLSAAIRINNQISIGGGPVVDFFHARLTQAVNIGPLGAVTGNPVGDVSGDDTAAGFVASGLYQVSPALRFGLVYRSRIQHDISGDQSVFVPPALGGSALAQLLAAGNSQARTKVTLPDTITGGAYYDVTPRLAVMADVQWTHWSLFKQLTIVPTNGGPVTTTPENWRNTWFGSVGLSYKLTKKLMLQGGVGYDESPTTDSNRTTRIPDYSRVLLGVGASYAVLPNVTLQASYLRLIDGTVNISNAASATSGRVVGRYADNANSASLGVTVKF